MKTENRNKFIKGNKKNFAKSNGYFVGQFMKKFGYPLLETDEVEIAWKKLPINFEDEKPHFHKEGVEVNIVISGKYKVWVEDEEIELKKGDFLVVYPQSKLKNISADKDTELIVVKAPSVPNDKFNE